MAEDSNAPIFRQICAALTVNILSVCYGLSVSNTNDFYISTVEAVSTRDDIKWFLAVPYFGGFVGIFIWNYVVDKFGRKINGYALALTQIIGWLGIIFSSSIIPLIISRFIISFGGAGIIIFSQLYVNETANEKIKGPLCALLIIAMQIGYIFLHTMDFLLFYNTLKITCLVVPVVFVLLYFWLPESPLYLLMHQKQDQAEKVLFWFNNGNIRAVEEKMKALTHSIDNNEKPPSLKHLFADQQTNRASLTAIIILAGYQLCGYPLISRLAEPVFMFTIFGIRITSPIDIYFSELVPKMVIYMIQFITASFMVFAQKYAPKRLVMGISYCVASLSLACILLFSLVDSKDQLAFLWFPARCCIFFLMCYSSGIGPVSFMILSEMLPARLLNNVISAGLLVSFSLTSITGQLFYFLDITGSLVMFSLINAALALYVLIFVKDSSLKLVK